MVCGKSVTAALATLYGNNVAEPVDPEDLPREDRKVLCRLRELLDGVISNEVEIEDFEEMGLAEEGIDADDDSEWDGDEEGDTMEKTRKPPTEMQVDQAIAFYRSGNLDTPDKRKTGTRALTSMTSRFRFIRDRNDLKSILEYERSGQMKHMAVRKVKALSEALENEVKRRIDKGYELHDRDLRTIATKINREFSYWEGFKGSPSWITRWKKKHRIVSRKITRIVSKKTLRDREQINERVKEFMKEFQEIVASDPTITIINCDQTAVLKEQHGQRTLAFIGEKKIESVVQSVANTTHSCTYMPIVSRDGVLQEKFFVQLSETSGALPKFKPVFSHPSLVLTAARSHIMNAHTTEKFFKEVLFAPLIRSFAPPGIDVTIINVPSGSTGFVEPLDVFYNQQFKNVLRRSDNHVIVHELPINIGERDNRLKVITQIHHQFRAPLYKEFIKYAWYKGGFLKDHPQPFKSPPDFLFCSTSEDPCDECKADGFIMCSYCCKPFCYLCFYIEFHRC